MGIRSDHYGVVEIGRAQSFVPGAIKGKIHQPVVHEIDRLTADRQHSLRVSQLRGIRDDRLNTMSHKESLRQQELRVKILFFRSVIDDGNPAERADLPLQPEFMLEHREHGRLEVGAADFPQRGFDLCTAGPLGIRQQGVQKRATRIRIDLDQLGS